MTLYTSENTSNWSFWRFVKESWFFTKGSLPRWKFLLVVWGRWRFFDKLQNED